MASLISVSLSKYCTSAMLGMPKALRRMVHWMVLGTSKFVCFSDSCDNRESFARVSFTMMLCFAPNAAYATMLSIADSLIKVSLTSCTQRSSSYRIPLSHLSPPEMMLQKCRNPGIQYGNDCTRLFPPSLLLLTPPDADSSLVGNSKKTVDSTT